MQSQPTPVSVHANTPELALSQLINGYGITQAIAVVAQLGIVDLLAATAQTSAELAQATGVHPLSLSRVLRFLGSIGLFLEDDQGHFHLTPLAHPLRSNVPGSLRPLAFMAGSEWS
jgi:C-methyltransferase